MTRNSVYSALILRARPSGESNRELWMLTAEEGILRVTMFGGPKSRLRSHAAPFHSGSVWIYHDPVRGSRKLGDFDVRSWRPGLRELYERTMTADALAETILASHGGGGGWENALALTEPVLDALENAGEELCARLLVYFFWRWANLLGLEPDMSACALCGREIPQDGVLFFSRRGGSCLCQSCGQAGGDCTRINAGGRRWLRTAESVCAAEICRYAMDAQSQKEAKVFTQTILAAALGKRPSSWDW